MKKTRGQQNGISVVCSFILVLFISGILLAACGYNPLQVFSLIIKGAFGSQSAIVQTLIQTTPLIFSGLAYIVASRAGMFNLGMEGQIYMGAIAAAVVGGIDAGLPAFIHIPLTLLAGCIAGGLYGALAGVMKVKFGANEVISTLMLNFVAINFTGYLVNYPLKADGPVAQTEDVMPTAMLPKLFDRYPLSIAILIALAAVVLIKIFIERTTVGYEIRVVGNNQAAAETAGISIPKILTLGMFLSGMIAGMGGACHITGVDRRFVDGFSNGYGFDGIAVAALAGSRPEMVLPAALIFGVLRAGALRLNMTMNLPTDFVSVIQGLVIIFVAAPMLIHSMGDTVGKVICRIKRREMAE